MSLFTRLWRPTAPIGHTPIVFDSWCVEDLILPHPVYEDCLLARDGQSVANVIDWWNAVELLKQSGLRLLA